jgi:hypothetical protein
MPRQRPKFLCIAYVKYLKYIDKFVTICKEFEILSLKRIDLGRKTQAKERSRLGMDLALERALKLLETPTGASETVEQRDARIKSCRLIAAHLCNPALRFAPPPLYLFFN